MNESILFKSIYQKRDERKEIFDKFSFKNGEFPFNREKISPRRNYNFLNQELNIFSNITKKINDINQTVIVKPPKQIYSYYRREIKESQLRIKKIKNGIPIFQAIKSNQLEIPIQEPITINQRPNLKKGYSIPNTEKNDFYFPKDIIGKSKGDQILNELEGLKYNIYEEDRERINIEIRNINRRNKRREKALKEQFELTLKFGFNESRKICQRSAQLSSLKDRKNEEWWPKFIEQYSSNNLSKEEFRILNLLSKTPLNEDSLLELANKEKNIGNNIEIFKKIILKANEIGKFTNNLWLTMTFRNNNLY